MQGLMDGRMLPRACSMFYGVGNKRRDINITPHMILFRECKNAVYTIEMRFCPLVNEHGLCMQYSAYSTADVESRIFFR